MNKKLFIKTINAIKKQQNYDDKVAKLLSKAFPNSTSADFYPEKNYLQKALVDILVSELEDKGEWIEYFIWELEFGKENKRLKAYGVDGEEIPLKNASDLYDFLIGEKEKDRFDRLIDLKYEVRRNKTKSNK